MNRWLLLLVLCFAGLARAHEVRPAYLQISQTNADQFSVLWKIPARGDRYMSLHLQWPEQIQVENTLPVRFVDGFYVQQYRLTAPDELQGASISVDGLNATVIDVLVRIEWLNGASQSARLLPDSPTLVVQTLPDNWQVFNTYFVFGVEHILLGFDHLLFVLALIILVKGWRRLIATVTAFTLAHSITLALASLQIVRVPVPPVEAVIALSIVFVAVEIVHARQGRFGLAYRAPWLVAFSFGLLHGLGFASALSEVGLPQHALVSALLAFNLGVEAGQLLFVATVLSLWQILKRLRFIHTPLFQQLPAYAIGSLAMFWVFERVSGF